LDIPPKPDPIRPVLGWAIPLALILTVLGVYAQTAAFDFVNFDDPLYVSRNVAVHLGLTFAGIKSAFTTVVASNWLPVTLLSHVVDAQLFGDDASIPHLENALIHAASAVVLFLFLRRATSSPWPSAFVAFIFALHPLHVESVAWISERKDVLSTLFLFLALYFYVRYAASANLRDYVLMAAAFALGLMSKPMLVTFPFLLLLLDIWPLDRARSSKIFLEKLPLVALSAISSVIAYRVQADTGAMAQGVPLDSRIAKALLSYITYMRQTIWPANLAVFYPYPHLILATRAAAALAILLAISAAVISARGTRPYLVTGWFWFLGTLVPVIGLVTIGQQSHADRYMYVPMTGLAMMVAWGGADILERWPGARRIIAAGAVLACLACLLLAFNQASYWKNSETLYTHAIEVTGDNWLAEANLGQYLGTFPDRVSEAMDHLHASLLLKPDGAESENNLGLLLSRSDRCAEAIPYFAGALRDRPSLIEAANNLGMCLTETGDPSSAITLLSAVVQRQPNYPEAHFNLAMALSQVAGHERDAVAEYQAGLRLKPDDDVAQQKLHLLLQSLGR
jgi:tetratricopeptide (TPR) repeat protein